MMSDTVSGLAPIPDPSERTNMSDMLNGTISDITHGLAWTAQQLLYRAQHLEMVTGKTPLVEDLKILAADLREYEEKLSLSWDKYLREELQANQAALAGVFAAAHAKAEEKS